MGNLALSNRILQKYFGFLKSLDDESKAKLIQKLKASFNKKPAKKFDLDSLFGAWKDSRDSDEIIAEIGKY